MSVVHFVWAVCSRVECSRGWSVVVSSRRDTVCSTSTLVVPLPRVVGYHIDKHRPLDRCLSLKEPGWFVLSVIRLCSAFIFLAECLAQIGQPAGEQSESEKSHMKQILALKDVHLLAVFILVYVGVEVTIGGMSVMFIPLRSAPDFARLDRNVYHRHPWRWPILWIYIIRVFRRYVTSSMSLFRSYMHIHRRIGLMTGRVVLLWINQKVCSLVRCFALS